MTSDPIGRRIRQLRIQAGFTQEQVALQAGLGLNGVHLAERRGAERMEVSAILRIAKVLRVPAGVLLGELPMPPRVRVAPAAWTVLCDQCGPVCTTATEVIADRNADGHRDWHLNQQPNPSEVAA